jgi:hypothetical protein
VLQEAFFLVTALPVITESWGPSWGKPPRETAETRHTGPQPSRHVRRKGAAPLSKTEEQTARTISAFAQYAFLLLFANWEHKLDLTGVYSHYEMAGFCSSFLSIFQVLKEKKLGGAFLSIHSSILLHQLNFFSDLAGWLCLRSKPLLPERTATRH